ncbi:hypothetical protein JNL27_15340 [bacterium]|nr:hypothetical protein [bacterium]
MKHFLYKFDFVSGLYGSVFLKQVDGLNEKDALVQIVSFFTDLDEKSVGRLLRKKLGKNWSVKKFWSKMDMDFLNSDESAGYQLMWLKEIKQDLES